MGKTVGELDVCHPRRVAAAGVVSRAGTPGGIRPSGVSLAQAALQGPKQDRGEGHWTFVPEPSSGAHFRGN